MKTLASVCTCAHTGQSLHCSYTQRMCEHLCTLACTNVHTFFVCTSSEDSGQCAHACIPRSVHKEGPCSVHKEDPCKCAHVRTLVRVFTAHTHKECMHMCACKCAHVCACSEDCGQYVYMWPESSLLHMFAYLHAQMCTHCLCVRAVKTLASVRMRAYRAASIKKAHAASIKKAHVCTPAHTGQSLHCSYTQRMYAHASVRMCVHTCVYEQ